MSRRPLRFALALLAPVFLAPPAGAQPLYSVSRNDAEIREIDPATGATLSSVTATLAGFTVQGFNGLANDPTDGQFYALAQLGGAARGEAPIRSLVTLDPITGLLNQIGPLPPGMASIAIAADGTLYGVTGDGGSPPETLFEIDKTTAAATLLFALGNGDDGEAIGYNPVDGLLYHASGTPFAMVGAPDGKGFVGGPVFESIDVDAMVITPIPLSGDVYFEALALVWDPEARAFLLSDLSSGFFTVTDSGVVTTIPAPLLTRALDHPAKGLAFARIPPVVEVPALSPTGLAVLALILGFAAVKGLRRRSLRH